MTRGKKPLVSVLIPTYNRAPLVGACIESALAQTLDDLEVVIVDNASTDETWALCQIYAARDSRVRLFRNETNVGPVRNWQRCVELARGEFAKLLFSDDTIDPEYLELTVEALHDPRVGFAFTAVRTGERDGAGTRVLFDLPSLQGPRQRQRFLLAALVAGSTPVSPGAGLFRTTDLRKSILADIPSPSLSGFASTGAGVDLLVYLLTAMRYPLVAHIRRPSAFFREHPQSISIERSELVHAQVRQARVWFCQTHLGDRFARALITLLWLLEMRRRRAWIGARQFTAAYSAPAAVPDLRSLLGAGALVATLLAQRLSARWPASHAAPG